MRRKRREVIDPRIRAEVIARFGNECWLNLPGCTKVGEEDDHIVPYSHGGKGSVANIRRACKHCNASRQDRVLSGYGARIHCVIGPLSASVGQTAKALAGDDAVLVSHAAIMQSMCAGMDDVQAVRIAAAMAWDAAYRQLAKTQTPLDVWFVRTLPRSAKHPHMLAEWVALDYDIHVADPGASVVMADLQRHGDVQGERVAQQWYAMRLTQARVDDMRTARRERLASLGLRDGHDSRAAPKRITW